MYIPSFFNESRIEVMHDLIRLHPLGIIITGGKAGLMASSVPFLVDAKEGTNGLLRAHMARDNLHWHELQRESECLVIFQGAQGYITPSWYPSKKTTHKVVPTWNYATVHAWGKPQIVEDAIWLRQFLEELTHSQEQKRAQPWKVSDAPDNFINTQMNAIVGFEIRIKRIEGKWKMSQNRPEADRTGVIEGLTADNNPHQNPALAAMVSETFRTTK